MHFVKRVLAAPHTVRGTGVNDTIIRTPFSSADVRGSDDASAVGPTETVPVPQESVLEWYDKVRQTASKLEAESNEEQLTTHVADLEAHLKGKKKEARAA